MGKASHNTQTEIVVPVRACCGLPLCEQPPVPAVCHAAGRQNQGSQVEGGATTHHNQQEVWERTSCWRRSATLPRADSRRACSTEYQQETTHTHPITSHTTTPGAGPTQITQSTYQRSRSFRRHLQLLWCHGCNMRRLCGACGAPHRGGWHTSVTRRGDLKRWNRHWRHHGRRLHCTGARWCGVTPCRCLVQPRGWWQRQKRLAVAAVSWLGGCLSGHRRDRSRQGVRSSRSCHRL